MLRGFRFSHKSQWVAPPKFLRKLVPDFTKTVSKRLRETLRIFSVATSARQAKSKTASVSFTEAKCAPASATGSLAKAKKLLRVNQAIAELKKHPQAKIQTQHQVDGLAIVIACSIGV